MTLQQTWNARSSYNVNSTTNQIASVDFAAGLDRITHTNSSGCKVYPQYVTNNTIGYLIKGGYNEGIHYTNGKKILGNMRSLAGASIGYGYWFQGRYSSLDQSIERRLMAPITRL